MSQPIAIPAPVDLLALSRQLQARVRKACLLARAPGDGNGNGNGDDGDDDGRGVGEPLAMLSKSLQARVAKGCAAWYAKGKGGNTKWEEDKHKRDHGKFSSTGGGKGGEKDDDKDEKDDADEKPKTDDASDKPVADGGKSDDKPSGAPTGDGEAAPVGGSDPVDKRGTTPKGLGSKYPKNKDGSPDHTKSLNGGPERDWVDELVNGPVKMMKGGGQPHAFITGESGSGKSVLTHHIAAERAKAGHEVVVIDGKPEGTGKWPMAEEIAETPQEYLEVLDGVQKELNRRKELAANSDHPEEELAKQPLTLVLSDVVTLLSQGDPNLSQEENNELKKKLQGKFLDILTRGRTLGVFVLMDAQVANVGALGLEGNNDLLQQVNRLPIQAPAKNEDYKNTRTVDVGGKDYLVPALPSIAEQSDKSKKQAVKARMNERKEVPDKLKHPERLEMEKLAADGETPFTTTELNGSHYAIGHDGKRIADKHGHTAFASKRDAEKVLKEEKTRKMSEWADHEFDTIRQHRRNVAKRQAEEKKQRRGGGKPQDPQASQAAPAEGEQAKPTVAPAGKPTAGDPAAPAGKPSATPSSAPSSAPPSVHPVGQQAQADLHSKLQASTLPPPSGHQPTPKPKDDAPAPPSAAAAAPAGKPAEPTVRVGDDGVPIANVAPTGSYPRPKPKDDRPTTLHAPQPSGSPGSFQTIDEQDKPTVRFRPRTAPAGSQAGSPAAGTPSPASSSAPTDVSPAAQARSTPPAKPQPKPASGDTRPNQGRARLDATPPANQPAQPASSGQGKPQTAGSKPASSGSGGGKRVTANANQLHTWVAQDKFKPFTVSPKGGKTKVKVEPHPDPAHKGKVRLTWTGPDGKKRVARVSGHELSNAVHMIEAGYVGRAGGKTAGKPTPGKSWPGRIDAPQTRSFVLAAHAFAKSMYAHVDRYIQKHVPAAWHVKKGAGRVWPMKKQVASGGGRVVTKTMTDSSGHVHGDDGKFAASGGVSTSAAVAPLADRIRTALAKYQDPNAYHAADAQLLTDELSKLTKDDAHKVAVDAGVIFHSKPKTKKDIIDRVRMKLSEAHRAVMSIQV